MMNNNPIWSEWISGYLKNQPFTIAGPCSAETEQQVLETARLLKKVGVPIFRAGIWKPRTRPGGFEGVGEIGLNWLKRAKEETGMLLATEVATPHHVKLALENDVDVLWVGARTTVNPFAVQELADELKDTEKIVLVKNPVNPDLALWIGAIERLHKAGIQKLGAIHRGFSVYNPTKYRNIPEWQIPLELQARFPDLPLICDPSHISGDRLLVGEISQQALNLGFDGLMIETHITPDEAWSDAAQQVTPNSLLEILKKLKIKKAYDSSEDFKRKIEGYRLQIDALDEKLIEILSKRMEIAERVGVLKQDYDVTLFQNKRWQEVQQQLVKEGVSKKLSEEFVISLYKAIHQESIARQELLSKSKQK